jgi:hypothetical protein
VRTAEVAEADAGFLCLGRTDVLCWRLHMGTVLLIILVLLLIGALPTWPYSSGWGYYPSGGLGLILVIVLILVLMGRFWYCEKRQKVRSRR